ncbi:hypothetical protein ACFYOV_33610 [Streptomyces sp. NPDC005931]|uniref:hypothetical protein n=1 Tax=Streptomyces sp. NPDC005931 TaxID=3364737 RepID=UPI00368AAC16
MSAACAHEPEFSGPPLELVCEDPGGNGVEVPFQTPGESLEAGQVGVGCRFDPCRQLVTLQLSEHVGEGADMPGKWSSSGQMASTALSCKNVKGTPQ